VAHAQDTRVPESAERGAGLTADEVNDGWVALFDGESLFGWASESDANWRVEDGCIVVDSGTEPGLLRTLAQFDEYVLRLKYLAEPTTNSGVFVRTSPRPTDPLDDCVEINIAPESNPFPSGSLVGRAKSAEFLPSDTWRELEIEVADDHVRVRIDGTELCKEKVESPAGRGYIGLQFNSGAIRFKDIRLKPLSLDSIFNGDDLAGWNVGPSSNARIEAIENCIQMQGGPGQLETEKSYADFVLQFRCRTKPQVNSGMFFRCIPGETMNGYEVQIDNGLVDGDRSKPANGGTGCIFRRNVARRIVGNDDQWVAITLVAEGPRFSVWVNGYQVTDWRDDREPHANPRQGQRLEAGTLILQAHDEGTFVEFAELQIAEMNARQRAKPDKD
jgi:hypothetical protein